jgi:hypothetical protein
MGPERPSDVDPVDGPTVAKTPARLYDLKPVARLKDILLLLACQFQLRNPGSRAPKRLLDTFSVFPVDVSVNDVGNSLKGGY